MYLHKIHEPIVKGWKNVEPIKIAHGRVSYKMSLIAGVIISGNFISNDTNKSPRLDGSLANGRPWPCNRFIVVGFITSDFRLRGIFLSVRVGTKMSVPHSACKI